MGANPYVVNYKEQNPFNDYWGRLLVRIILFSETAVTY